MAVQHSAIQSAEDFVRSVLEKNFNQKTSEESVKAAAEKIARSLPVNSESAQAKRAA